MKVRPRIRHDLSLPRAVGIVCFQFLGWWTAFYGILVLLALADGVRLGHQGLRYISNFSVDQVRLRELHVADDGRWAVAFAGFRCQSMGAGIVPDVVLYDLHFTHVLRFPEGTLAYQLAHQDGATTRAVLPMLIYDGERTWLFPVSQPWAGFTAWPDDPTIFVHPGLHSAVRANTATKVDQTWAAVLMLPTLDMDCVTYVAAALIHEAFHVFQLLHHPGWTANEVELFKYPELDQTMLACRYAEDESLDRAAQAKAPDESLAWARAAVELRARRAERMPEGSLRYERDLEVLEGLAHYVQLRAAGSPDAILRRPDNGFAPEQVRGRSYWTGVQWATILDRLDSGWQDRLRRDDQLRLDQLADQLTSEKSIPAMRFEPEEWNRFETLATERVTELQATRDRRRSEFWAAPGLQLEIHASAERPLRPQGFDPMNITLLADREVLHHRYLKLGNASGSVELLNRAGLTIGAGEHPLSSGVRQLIITGLDSPGEVEQSGSRVRLEMDGLKLDFNSATLERNAERLILRIE